MLLSSLLIQGRVHAGNVIFIHPDGAGISHWQAARFYWAGPDKDLNWDRLENVAVYRGHMEDSLTASSNGGATVHAYGVKVPYRAFGTAASGQRPVSASGKPESILHEAIAAGHPTALVNSGSIVEPGTAAFAASVASRSDGSGEIVAQIIQAGIDVILSGGEEWFLPEGTAGRFCKSGKRKDGRNLIEEAKNLGYQVVFDLQALQELPSDTRRVLGIFSEEHTFNDKPEAVLAFAGLKPYKPEAPTIAEMTGQALRFLQAKKQTFFLVVEEEGTDNFGNCTNALGTLEALKRADDAFGVALDFLGQNPETLIITAADSSAGGMDVISYPLEEKTEPLMNQFRDRSGAEWDRDSKGKFLLSKPNRNGVQLPFIVTWATTFDASGGIVIRASGENANAVRGTMDNTAIYAIMHKTLFSP